MPTNATSEIDEILLHLQASIDTVVTELKWLGQQDPARIALYGPFLGRSLQELSVTALIARLDPFRLLFVREVQGQPSYTLEGVWKSSIRWKGDVLVAAEKKTSVNLWSAGVAYEDITKAIFGDYYDHLLWRPAHSRAVNAAPAQCGSLWLADLLASTSDSFVPRRRSEAGKQYSALSKGLHHEFVLPPGSLYDRATVADLVHRTLHTVSDMALVSHFVATASYSLPPDDAFSAFNQVEDLDLLT